MIQDHVLLVVKAIQNSVKQNWKNKTIWHQKQCYEDVIQSFKKQTNNFSVTKPASRQRETVNFRKVPLCRNNKQKSLEFLEPFVLGFLNFFFSFIIYRFYILIYHLYSIIRKCSILDDAGVLNMPLVFYKWIKYK